MSCETVLKRALVRLAKSNPLLVALARVECQATSDTHEDLEDDVIYLSPEEVAELNDELVAGLIAHQALHILLKHSIRFRSFVGKHGERGKAAFRFAADAMVNDMLKELAPELPIIGPTLVDVAKVLQDVSVEELRRMSVEEIAEKLIADVGEMNEWPGGSCSLKPATGQGMIRPVPLPMRLVDEPFAKEFASAGKDAISEINSKIKLLQRSYGNLPGTHLLGFLPELESRVDWVKVLTAILRARYGRTMYNTLQRPLKKAIAASPIVQPPGREKVGIGDVIVAIDVSGSVTDEELGRALDAIKKLARTFDPNIKVLVWDVGIRRVIEYRSYEQFKRELAASSGRGGTDPEHVFEALRSLNWDTAIIISDFAWPPGNWRAQIERLARGRLIVLAATNGTNLPFTVPRGVKVVEV